MPGDRPPTAAERELRFSQRDVALFAAASGDRNPLHLDPAFGRRTPFGSCIVHGALAAIGLLGSLPPSELARVRALRVRFAGPVLPGQACSSTASRARAGGWEGRLTGRGKVLVQVMASADRSFVAKNLARGGALRLRPSNGADAPRILRTPAEPGPDELTAGHTAGGVYAPGAGLAELASRFGAERLNPGLLVGLAWASYVVGMELPGLHSLLAAITLSVDDAARPDAPAPESIRVRDHDPRTGQIVLDCALLEESGAARTRATIECFAVNRVAPLDVLALGVAQPAQVDRGRVVVIGASRGFGGALTLALLARGYSADAVYSASSDSAAELAELAGPNRERLRMHRLDARDARALGDLAEQLAKGEPLAGVVLSAGLAPLAMGLSADSAHELSRYVADSVELAAAPLGALLPLLAPDSWVLFCSSSALVSPPRDWPHYVTAKAALEGLAAWVAATVRSARAVVIRPPAMRTELTNTPSGRVCAVPTETVAAWIADQLVAGELPPGLTVLDPDAAIEVVG